ncbi:MAG: hypothetical protein COA96_11290 [SAR86 cluster bacterium]|uniref:Peptidase M56 domain-containing protein n=1 Tax=SAR86 cluster bacterium TaxID=2030880 RepID=A0A2A5AXP3_9GAMM|nr:MAG: hypothetical protein COA96_11290 [SAR86 cluster bacterium]
MLNTLVALLAENPILLIGLDLFAKSTVVLLFTLVASHLVRTDSFSVRSKHLLWLTGLLCLALIPLVSVFPGILDTESKFHAATLTLPTTFDSAEESKITSFTGFSSNTFLLLAYLGPCLLLLSRMVFAVMSVFGIGARALPNSNRRTLEISTSVARKLRLSRSVEILQSKEVTSPFSFGIFAPKIILPDQANEWSESTVEDVLVHELTHIKRLDWPSTIFCHFVASLYWINPLCWIAINRISEEAENSCDAAVLGFGRNGADYARNLILIARRSRDGNRLLTQMMADNRMLPKRVQRILKGKTNTKVNKIFLPMLTTTMLALVASFGSIQILAFEPSALSRSDPKKSIESSPAFIVAPHFGQF